MLLFAPEAFGTVLILLWLYCIFDVISTDEALMRNLPKGAWVLIVIFLPDVGSLAWLLLGRPLYAGWRPGSTEYRAPRSVRGPEDGPAWRPSSLTNEEADARLQAWEDDLARRERELGAERPQPPKADDKPDDPGFRW
ncbi:MAG: putative secreted protein [Actinomycetia bacterium]|nr:putative secreted protein [Actinomycetes bacterium]